MFERFTERARQVVVLAQEEARALGHNYIGTEHLLLGLLREEEGIAARLLVSLGVPIEEARAQVVRIVPATNEVVRAGQIPFAPRAKRVLELSLREALSLGHNWIGTEHILLGLVCEDEGVGARVLLELGADPETIRDGVISLLSDVAPMGYTDGERGIELRLRRVSPIARQLADGAWIVSAEVWDHGITLHWAESVRPPTSPRFGVLHGGWHISDDAGTNYERVGGSSSGGPQRGFHGDVKFEPAPPPEATRLRIRREGLDDEISVSLTD